MLQEVSILSYISPGSFLGKSMIDELLYNFPLMSMYFTYRLLRIPKTDAKNGTVTFTGITVLKRCSALVTWRGRTIDQRTFFFVHRLRRLVPNSDEKQTRVIKYSLKRDNCRKHSPHVACNLSFAQVLPLKIELLTSNLP